MHRERAVDPHRAETGRRRRIAAVKGRAVPEHLAPREIIMPPKEPPLRIAAARRLRGQTMPLPVPPLPIVADRRHPARKMPRPEPLPRIVEVHKPPEPKTLQPARPWPIATSRSIREQQAMPQARPPYVARIPIPFFTEMSGTAHIPKFGLRAG